MRSLMKIIMVALIGALFCAPALSTAIELGDVDIHGFVSQGYLESTDNNYLAETEDGTFEFNEFGLNFATEFDKLRIAFQLFSRDLGDEGNNDISLDWAMGDYRFNDAFGIRAGKIKMPIGFYNQLRDLDMLRTSIFLPASIYGETMREITNAHQGGEVYGFLNAGNAGDVSYKLFYGTIDVDEDSLFINNMLYQLSFLSDPSVTNEYVTGGALQWNTFIQGLRLGASYWNGDFDADATANDLLGPGTTADADAIYDVESSWVASIGYNWLDLELTAEYRQEKYTLAIDVDPLGEIIDDTTTSEGWYIMASYRVKDWLAAGLYYSEYYSDRDDKDGENLEAAGTPDYYAWQKEIVPTIRFDINEYWNIKLEAHFVNGAAQVLDLNNTDGKEEDWTLYAVKTSFSF